MGQSNVKLTIGTAEFTWIKIFCWLWYDFALIRSRCPSTECLQRSVDTSLHQWWQNKFLLVCCSWQMKRLCYHGTTLGLPVVPLAFARASALSWPQDQDLAGPRYRRQAVCFSRPSEDASRGQNRAHMSFHQKSSCLLLCVFNVCLWTQTDAQCTNTLAGGSVLDSSSEWKRQQLSSESSALGCNCSDVWLCVYCRRTTLRLKLLIKLVTITGSPPTCGINLWWKCDVTYKNCCC